MIARVLSRVSAVFCLVTLIAASPALGQFGRQKPKAKVDLLAAVDAVIPGESFDVALRFEFAEGWHIYWIHSGQSGMPPRVTWALPDGFTAGPVRFPIPKRHADKAGITTNILDGEPMLPITIESPAVVASDRVRVQAKVRYLICKDICLIENADLDLSLPVRREGPAKEANADLFEAARHALPKQTSKHVSVTPKLDPGTLSTGRTSEFLLTVAIADRIHIQAHKPLQEMFVPTDVFMEPTPGITFGEPVFPDPHFRTLPVLGKVAEYSGRIEIRIPAEVDEELPSGPLSFAGVLTFQGCNDKGTCFPPSALGFHLDTRSTDAGTGSPTPKAPSEGQVDVAATGDSGGPSDRDVTASPPGSSAKTNSTDSAGLEAFLGGLGTPGLLFMCFLYGLFINATPCVLPLLSIKVLGFVQQAHEKRGRTLLLGLAFGTGVMIFFVALGLLASRGGNVLQYPAAVIALGAIVMALALSMLGVYTLQVPIAATKLEANIRQEGLVASFGKGALAPVLGFACTGPFMAAAFGWATQQTQEMAILAFLVMGLGMASPYVLLGANPNWLGFLPKPGHWMITFERIMGFLLLGMVVWLIHPLVAHIGTTGLEWTFVFLVAVAMACWMLGTIDMATAVARRWRIRGGAGALTLGAGVLIYGWIAPLERIPAHIPEASPDGLDWRPWSAQAVEAAVRSGNPVFVDFTAAYCTGCKANKAIAINTPEVRDKMKALGVITFRGDFTNGDPAIFQELQKRRRAGVPFNMIYPAGKPDSPIVLRTQLTKSYLLEKLDEAGAS